MEEYKNIAEIKFFDIDTISDNIIIYGENKTGKTTFIKNIIDIYKHKKIIKVVTQNLNEYKNILSEQNILSFDMLDDIIFKQIEEEHNLMLIIDEIKDISNEFDTICSIIKKSKFLGITLVIASKIILDNEYNNDFDFIIMFNDFTNIVKYWSTYGLLYDKTFFSDIYLESVKNKYECLILDIKYNKFFWYKYTPIQNFYFLYKKFINIFSCI